MVQVENEIGMIPDARDRSADANRVFDSAVPGELTEYLSKQSETLAPELRSTWLAAGAKRAGTWTEVFGDGAAAEEIFMAWHFARFTQHVAAAGKAEYPLPMFVNAALIRPGYQPGQYPSAGPLPHLIDVWRAGSSGGRLHRAGHLFPDVRRVDAALRARRQPALHSRGAAQSGRGGERALRLRGARRHRFLAVRHRVDRRAGRRACSPPATTWWTSSRRSSSNTAVAAR